MRESLQSVLSQLPASFYVERQELLRLILRDAILRRSDTQPIVSRDGTSARWMLDSLSVTMQARGAQLAAACILRLLEHFDGRQLATYGVTGIPLLQAIIVQSGGRYSGLLVRKNVKGYGSMRRIEGQVSRDRPVILIDDSISSGLSMREACEHLEEAGLRVEGGIVLVRFGWEHGHAAMQERGYHMEAIYDVWDDLMPNIEGEPEVNRNPTKEFDSLPWAEQMAEGGLHPARLARVVLEELIRNGRLLQPPRSVDTEYDASGGAWVSLRDRNDIYLRYVRDGFWNFPYETSWEAGESVVRAAWLAARGIGRGDDALALLDRSAIGITFFGELQECKVGDLDNDRYGIVVCSRERPSVMGGALPRMPGIAGEWEQFRHAACKNAGLKAYEPYVIYLHEVRKVVEPGASWHTSGAPAHGKSQYEETGTCRLIAERARDIAIAKVLGVDLQTTLPSDALLSPDPDSLYVSIYIAGRLRGCAGSPMESLDRDLHVLVEAALTDSRFADHARPEDASLVAVTVSFLFDRLKLGEMSPEEVSTRFRLADQALAVRQNHREGLLLPFVAVTNNLDRKGFVAEVIDKAGVTRPPYEWIRYDCATWLADKDGCSVVHGALREPSATNCFEQTLQEMMHWHCDYLVRNQRSDGDFYFTYEPFRNYRYLGAGAPHSAHCAWVLLKAARILKKPAVRQAGERAIDFHLRFVEADEGEMWLRLGDQLASVSELVFTLLALLELPHTDDRRHRAEPIARTLWLQIDGKGHVRTHRDETNVPEEFQDYFPGQVLLALAAAAHDRIAEVDKDKLLRAFQFYRHRYRYKRDFGQVSWLMQAACRWWEVTRDPWWAELVFEIGDWIVSFQLKKNGGFITGQQADGPGYTTALYLEGLSAGADLARQLGESAHYSRYVESCKAGFTFLRRLLFRPEHETVLPNGGYALGGLRGSLQSSDIRTDFMQHSLAAALQFCSNLGLAE